MLSSLGAATVKQYPYTGKVGQMCNVTSVDNRTAIRLPSPGYNIVNGSRQDIKAAVLMGPVAVYFYAPEDFMFYRSGAQHKTVVNT